MFRFSLPASCAVIVTLAGCALDPASPHPFVARATADASKFVASEDAVVTVPTAVIMRGGKVVAANARVAKVWPPAGAVPVEAMETDAPILVKIEPDDAPALLEPVPEPFIQTAPADVPAPAIALEEVVPEVPNYVEVSAIPDEPVLPVYEAAPLLEPAPPLEPVPAQRPAQLPYGASL